MKMATKLGVAFIAVFIFAGLIGYGAAAASDVTGVVKGDTYNFTYTISGSSYSTGAVEFLLFSKGRQRGGFRLGCAHRLHNHLHQWTLGIRK